MPDATGPLQSKRNDMILSSKFSLKQLGFCNLKSSYPEDIVLLPLKSSPWLLSVCACIQSGCQCVLKHHSDTGCVLFLKNKHLIDVIELGNRAG